MTNPYLEHPNEEALERFLLNKSEDQELEVLETHMLACESCITRLETLETQLSDLKTALIASEERRIQKELNPVQSFWKNWFTIPRLSWAGAACAALAIGLTVIPHSLRKAEVASPNGSQAAVVNLSACSGSNNDVDLATCRGSETTSLPGTHPLDLRVDATDITPGQVDVQVVNGTGAEIWQGQTTVKNDRAEVKLPQLSQSGPYFLRFYAQSAGPERELLREFRFEVK